MTETIVVQEGQVWQVANSGRMWTVRSVELHSDSILIENDQGYKTHYSSRQLLADHTTWTLIEDPTDPNLAEFIAQKCSECGEVQGVVSREDIRNRKVARLTLCANCDLSDPYEEDEYYDDEEYDR